MMEHVRIQSLSVLIPIYNFDIRTLVNVLFHQLQSSGILFEIRLYDDGSTDKWKKINQQIAHLQFVTYVELASNMGRSKIRNLLAREAQHDFLLFLDCDSEVVSDNYIKVILDYPIRKYSVIVGGRTYSDTPPPDRKLYLHWLAGKHKEEAPAAKRNLHPYHSFLLNNMVIYKNVFHEIMLDEYFTTYGHEDTKFGLELEKRNYLLLHTDNPVLHIDINTNKDYLNKSMQAIDNLWHMIEYMHIGRETKLYKTYYQLKRLRLLGPITIILKKLEGIMHQNLLSKNPSLFIFDLYKLNYFIKKYKIIE